MEREEEEEANKVSIISLVNFISKKSLLPITFKLVVFREKIITFHFPN